MNDISVYRFVGSITEFNSISNRSKMKFCYICSQCNKITFVKGFESISHHSDGLICKTCRLQNYNNFHPEVKTARANGIRSMTLEQKQQSVTKFKRTWASKIDTEIASILDKRKQTCRENLGVDFPSQSELVKQKIKNKRESKTKEEMDEIYDKVRQSWINKTSKELESINNKKRITKAINHNGNETYNNREKFKKTWNEKSEKDKALMVERVKQTKIVNHNDPNYNNREKAVKTSRKTCLKKYHKSYYVETDKFLEASKKTCNKNFNNDTYFGSKEFYDRMESDYGSRRPPSFRYNYYGIMFDSSWELAVWIYYIDHNIKIIREPISFIYNNTSKYIPDFWINGIGYVEIKGDQFFDNNGNMINPYDSSLNNLYERKRKCAIENGVKIWRKEDIKPYIEYCNKYHPRWDIIFKMNRFEFYKHNCYLEYITPYNLKVDNDNYCQLSDRGITPFDNNTVIK